MWLAGALLIEVFERPSMKYDRILTWRAENVYACKAFLRWELGGAQI
jgi:hypothetical protein